MLATTQSYGIYGEYAKDSNKPGTYRISGVSTVTMHDKVYLSVYEVEGAKSDCHAVSRVAITRMDR